MNYVFLIAFLCPFFSPIPFSTLYSWKQLWFIAVTIDEAWILACHKRYTYKAQFNIKSIAKQATPSLPPVLHEKQLSSAVNFANTFTRRLFAPKEEQQNQHSSAFVRGTVQHWFSRCLRRLCWCSVVAWGVAEGEVLGPFAAVNLFGLQTAKRQ